MFKKECFSSVVFCLLVLLLEFDKQFNFYYRLMNYITKSAVS